MAETTPEFHRFGEEEETSDIHGTATKILRANEAYEEYAGVEEKPAKGEVLGWFLYELCFYFVHTVLVPIVFPLLLSQIKLPQMDDSQEWVKNSRGFECRAKEMRLYEGLTLPSIKLNNLNFSPLEWASTSWAIGLILPAPILTTISLHLDYGHRPQLIAAAATAAGALFCLPVGFFKTPYIFLPYIAAVVAANTVCSAAHTRHLGLMIRGFIGSSIRKTQFRDRRAVAGWLSLFAAAAGTLGSAVIAAFTYHMLRHDDDAFLSLWIVSIFSGLIWVAGIVHVVTGNRPGLNPSSSIPTPKSHFLSIFHYPHAAGTLAGVFLSSFSTTCIFAGGLLYLIGQLCFKPLNILSLLLTYFLFPLLSLPLIQPLQNLIKADAVKMQIMGFLLSTLTAGFGFYHRRENWRTGHALVFAAVQGAAAGLLHAFGRVLLLDCSPAGKEGAFSVWVSWVRAVGACAGFAVATGGAGNVNRAFGVAFCGGLVGIVVLIFGNVSSLGGAVAAGHVREEIMSEKGSPARGLDEVIVEAKVAEAAESPCERKVEVEEV